MSINTNNVALNEILETINELPNSKEEQTKTVDITENGTTVVTPDEGKTLGEVTVNVEVESSSGEEFAGFKLSGFSGSYNLPTVADARSIPVPPIDILKYNTKFTSYWFYNSNSNGNGGYWVLLEDIYMPDGLLYFGPYMCQFCSALKNIYGNFANIQTIGTAAFKNCTSLINIPQMSQLKNLDGNAFQNCTGLTEFKFYTKPDAENGVDVTIASTAFNGCTNLLDIYVSWAEGEVANAPWGATNATIHYNTTYDENGNPIVSEV